MTTQNNSSLHTNVMRRVYIIHVLNPLFTATVFSVFVFLLAGWGIGREVWLAHILQNMPSPTDIGAVARFYLAAFANTRFIVQALSIIVVGAFIWLVVSVAKTLKTLTRFV
ncbi:hypothetical protein H0X32_02480 [Patescibacteria group bacterium]|nr:hypothetical protein [Patescibacteria group bacterium]